MVKMLRIVSYFETRLRDKMSAKIKYFNGLYAEAAETKISIKDVAYSIGGLVFTGQHQKARILYKEHYKKLKPEDKIIAGFHIGISHVRTSEYALAKKYFIENLIILRTKKQTSMASFFAYQGFSFYRYFFSQHKKSQKWAERGYVFLLNDKKTFPLLMALSMDIQGHNQIQLGRIHLGLSLLIDALNISKKNQLSNLYSEIEVSLNVYKSEFDDKPKEQIENLKSLLKQNESKNDYSHSSLVLQVAKLYLLLGNFKSANDFITSHYEVIYKNENKRYIAALNTLISHLLYKKGQFIEALSVAKIARRNLDEKIDMSLILPILNLEIKILKQLHKDTSPLMEYGEDLAKKIDRQLNLKVFNRNKDKALKTVVGEDKLGDLIDRLYTNDEEALNYVFKNELLGLLPRYFKISPGTKTLLLLEDKKHLIIFDLEDINHIPKLTRIQILFLKNLSSKGVSKQELIENVWGYEYDPLRHDSLIYTTVARLKKILGRKKHWIVSEENEYFLRDDVQVLFKSTKLHKNETKKNTEFPNALKDKNLRSKSNTNLTHARELNYRQIQLLSDPPERHLSVSDYAKLWNVTRMTSLRDLNVLCNLGYVTKSGRGKATRYLIN